MKQWMSSTTAFLPCSLGWPTPLQLWQSCPWDLGRQGHFVEDANAGYASEYLQTLTPNGFPKTKLALKVGFPVILLCNMKASKGLCKGTRLLTTHTSTHVLEGHILVVNMMESQCSFLESPYTHVRVTLPSFLHGISSQFALPLHWQSTKAKGNQSSMEELTCIHLSSHMDSSMLPS